MNKIPFSIEFFPPQTTEGADKLRVVRQKLAVLKPEFFSVTFGAGGTTQERTFETVFEIQSEGHQAAPHLSCIGSTRPHIRDILQRYKEAGIRRIVALRGDLPSGVGYPGELRYANELVEFIRQRPAITSTSKLPPTPNTIPRPETRGTICWPSSARWMPAPIRPSPNISTTSTPTCIFATNAPPSA
jgi:5,10-methylenetetrahydrofolate reductase